MIFYFYFSVILSFNLYKFNSAMDIPYAKSLITYCLLFLIVMITIIISICIQ